MSNKQLNAIYYVPYIRILKTIIEFAQFIIRTYYRRSEKRLGCLILVDSFQDEHIKYNILTSKHTTMYLQLSSNPEYDILYATIECYLLLKAY